jgi:hypothetical protein
MSMTEKIMAGDSALTFKKLLSFLWLTADSDHHLSIEPRSVFRLKKSCALAQIPRR